MQCFQNLGESGRRNVLTQGFQVPSVYPIMCGIQREVKKNIKPLIVVVFLVKFLVESQSFESKVSFTNESSGKETVGH